MGNVIAFRYKQYRPQARPYMKGRIMPGLWNDDWHDKYVNEKYRNPCRRRERTTLSLTMLVATLLCVAYIIFPTHWLFVAAGAVGVYALVLAHRYDMGR